MDKLIENFKKIFSTNNSRKRNIENLIIFLVGIIIIIFASGYIFNKEDETVITYNKTDIFDPDVFENKLNKILSNIEGAGNVFVMISKLSTLQVMFLWKTFSPRLLITHTYIFLACKSIPM